jgi:hypothetical protein
MFLEVCVILGLLVICHAGMLSCGNYNNCHSLIPVANQTDLLTSASPASEPKSSITCYTDRDMSLSHSESWYQSVFEPAVEAYQTKIGNTGYVTYAFETIASYGPNRTYTLSDDGIPRLAFSPSPTVFETKTVFVTRKTVTVPSDQRSLGITPVPFCKGARTGFSLILPIANLTSSPQAISLGMFGKPRATSRSSITPPGDSLSRIPAGTGTLVLGKPGLTLRSSGIVFPNTSFSNTLQTPSPGASLVVDSASAVKSTPPLNISID